MTGRSGLILGLALVLIGVAGLIAVGLFGAGGPNGLTCPGGGACFGGEPTGPLPHETGFKDTVIALPGQVTRIRATFARPGQYVWHCHIVEHEDNEMMRPFRIGPEQPGQPALKPMAERPGAMEEED